MEIQDGYLQQLLRNRGELPPPVERYVNRMVAEVMNIVISLGYQNPEEVINAYANHVPMDLAKKDMLFQLLQKLRQAVETKRVPLPPVLERARELFGEDFLGDEAIIEMASAFEKIGKKVEFELSELEVDCTEEYIEQAFNDREQGRDRMFVRRPSWMIVDGERMPITINNLYRLFQVKERDPSDPVMNTVLKNPFKENDGLVIGDWPIMGPTFVNEQLQEGYSLPTKEVIPGSINKTYAQQELLLEPEEKRRTAVEALWDVMLCYAKTGKKLLRNFGEWGVSVSSSGWPVSVAFGEKGIGVDFSRFENSTYDNIGLCPQKVILTT